MKKMIASAIALLRQAEKDWSDKPKGKTAVDKGLKGREKARKAVQKAIDTLEEALRKNSGSGQDDKNP
jgi:hypothetical protein